MDNKQTNYQYIMNKKELYVRPTIDVFVVQNEGVICGSDFGGQGAPGSAPAFNDYPDF